MIAPGMDGEMPAEEWPIKNRTMANWLQDSMNVHFDKVPPSRPYMMPNKVYEFLQKAEDSQDRKTVNRKEYSKKTWNQSEAPVYKNLKIRVDRSGTDFIYPHLDYYTPKVP